MAAFSKGHHYAINVLAAEQQALAIIGMGCRFPGGCDDADGFWSFLMSGGDGIVGMPMDRWPAEDAPRLVRRG
eukprot:23752-Eustigmatos_ZCMA.PRE.1